jgi:hypothetical protein
MIDMPTVGGYGSYHAFSNDAKRNGDTEESSFSRIFGGQETEESHEMSSSAGSVFSDSGMNGVITMDFSVYTIFGKLRTLGSLSGRNINIEV